MITAAQHARLNAPVSYERFLQVQAQQRDRFKFERALAVRVPAALIERLSKLKITYGSAELSSSRLVGQLESPETADCL